MFEFLNLYFKKFDYQKHTIRTRWRKQQKVENERRWHNRFILVHPKPKATSSPYTFSEIFTITTTINTIGLQQKSLQPKFQNYIGLHSSPSNTIPLISQHTCSLTTTPWSWLGAFQMHNKEVYVNHCTKKIDSP